MPKLIIVKGLPASGKSTFGKKLMEKSSNLFRVERDCLREMLFGKLFTGKGRDEKLVTKIQTAAIQIILQSGYDVISTDTNLNPETVNKLSNLAKECGANVEINDSLLSVPIDDCIKRDLVRPNSVGEKVIREFASKYLSTKVEKLEQDTSLPKAAIFDLDGTVCLMNGRTAFEWNKVGTDLPNKHVISAIEGYYDRGYRIIFLSGRDSICRNDSIKWLEKYTQLGYGVDFSLYMREYKDNRKDSIIKRELFDTYIRNNYFIEAVYDDRAQVVRMWTELGLNVFRCGIIDQDEF